MNVSDEAKDENNILDDGFFNHNVIMRRAF